MTEEGKTVRGTETRGRIAYPIEMDSYATSGTDANGTRWHFPDLVEPGYLVGNRVSDDDPHNVFPPLGTVVRREDGSLWVEAEEPTP